MSKNLLPITYYPLPITHLFDPTIKIEKLVSIFSSCVMMAIASLKTLSAGYCHDCSA
ncbi:MAG: hypothetical protein HEQ20_00015 [Aphanizomenon flos-aquae KM1D3_PB]|uniref:hypothetical protein n=1 Tax=Aphanizomenon flos-aquae TaxID=1176 RepID=UPI001363EE2F|nr:hypothetical protein [Aphanizomenon flos-aquae]QSV69408.1 MAG: hypothetical protein HEQ20_00015 [Aphanizomenon flos-aquae KM1D3_PB]